MRPLGAHLFLDLIGAPFVAAGRGPSGYDCVGLAIEIQRRRGLTVPDFLSSEDELHRQLAAGGFHAGCRSLHSAEAGCAVLMRSFGQQRFHLGVMVDGARMIHAAQSVGSVVIERLASSLWSGRILGFYAIDEVPA